MAVGVAEEHGRIVPKFPFKKALLHKRAVRELIASAYD
jgi:hypothetical protein